MRSWKALHDGHWKSAYSCTSTGADGAPSISESFGPSCVLRRRPPSTFSLFDRLDCTTMPTTTATTTTPITIHHCQGSPVRSWPRRLGRARRRARAGPLRGTGGGLRTSALACPTPSAGHPPVEDSAELGPSATSTARPSEHEVTDDLLRVLGGVDTARRTAAAEAAAVDREATRPRRADHRDERDEQYRRHPRRRSARQTRPAAGRRARARRTAAPTRSASPAPRGRARRRARPGSRRPGRRSSPSPAHAQTTASARAGPTTQIQGPVRARAAGSTPVRRRSIGAAPHVPAGAAEDERRAGRAR